MKIKIIGSGGCVSTPRPCCQCKVCVQARKLGFPYARTGCSLFIEEANVLIDTPEDINYALNNANVEEVECILYSHIDPDHTMGMRVVEQLRMDWLLNSVGKKKLNPIKVNAFSTILQDLKKQGTKYGSALAYYEQSGLVTLHTDEQVKKDDITIDLIPVNTNKAVTVFVIQSKHTKVVYAPCDVKPFPDHALFQNADVLIIGNTIVGDVLKDEFVLEDTNPLKDELFVMDEIVELKRKYEIEKVIITHLEEDWGKSYDDYKKLEQEYENIYFAFDGMAIELL